MTQMVQFYGARVENIVGKRENAGDQHFLLFSQCFSKASFSGCQNQGLFGKVKKCSTPC